MVNMEIDDISLSLRMLSDAFRTISLAVDCEHSVLNSELLSSTICTNCNYMEILLDQLDAANK